MTISPNVKSLTAKYVEAGASIIELSELFAIPTIRMSARLRQWGLQIKTRSPHRRSPDTSYDERNKAICAMYEDDRTLEEVGHAFKITRERVRQILVKNNITERRFKEKKRRLSEKKQGKEMMLLYLQGYQNKEIAKLLNVSYKLVRRCRPKESKIQYRQHRIAYFWRHVDKDQPNHPVLGTPCWLWTCGKNDVTGYGRFGYEGKINISTHRFVYEITKGAPKNWVLHWCDNPICVNPKHLYDGTAKENARDRDLKHGRKARLTDIQIQTIKSRLNDGESLEILAQEFGRCPSTIYNIQKGHVYSHRGKFNDESIRRVWACRGNKTLQETRELTGIGLNNIQSIWSGYRGNHITGLPIKVPRALGNQKRILITFRSETHYLCDWAKLLHIERNTLKYRIRHWGIEKAMTTPPPTKMA